MNCYMCSRWQKENSHKWVLLAHSKVSTPKPKCTELTLLKSPVTLVFLSSVESIISGLPSPRKVVTLSQSPQNPESPIPDGPIQQQWALRVERVYTRPAPSRARVNSMFAQPPEVNVPRLPHLSGWSNILLETVTHAAHIRRKCT